MTEWRRLSDRTVQYAPIALRPIDDFTADSPIVETTFVLDRKVGTRWVETGIEAVRTPSGLTIWPGLGRVRFVAAEPVAKYRVRFADPNSLGIYRPAFAFALDGLEFDVASWNDTNPPASLPDTPALVYLYPGVSYPFPKSVPLLRGRTVDAANNPLANALVTGGTDNVVSDERGGFALPIRLSASPNSIVVTAEHQRSNTAGDVTVSLPGGLATAVDIQLI